MSTARRMTTSLCLALLLLGGALVAVIPAHAAQVQNRSLQLSTSQGSASNVIYNLGFTLTSSYMLGSIALEICTEDPLPDTPCTSPVGFDALGATLAGQSGETGFSIHANTTVNRVVIGRPAAMSAPVAVSYQFGGITNPDIANRTYFARIYTYTSTDGTGVNVDDGGIAFAISNRIQFTTEVPPYLLFCLGQSITGLNCATATGDFLDFGEFSKTSVKTVESQMIVAENAAFGVNIFASGITLTSGNNIIPNLVAPTTSSPGTSQFGLNLRANSNPNTGQDPSGPGTVNPTPDYNIPNRFTFRSGDAVASGTGSSDLRKFTTTYIANIANGQAPGVYNTTLTYIALASY